MSITSNFPAIKPTLLLDFANTKQLDSRITFTRASTATYYGTQTAKAEENLVLQSQDFTTTWAANNITITANTQAAPDGTTTAETLDDDVANAVHDSNQVVVTTSGLTYTLSAFLKNGTRQFAILACSGSTTSYATAKFDLSAGTLGSTAASGAGWSVVSSSITSVGNSWYRCTITFVVGTTIGTAVRIGMGTDGTTFTASQRGLELYTGTDATIFAWGAQLEQRSAATAYTPTTTQTITNYIPQLLTAASGVARFDNNPTTFESLGLEIEESRTNLVTYSEQFNNAAWTATNATITANTIVSPDGTVDADSISETTATGSHRVRTASISVSASTSYTCTVFAKLGFGSVRYLGIGLSSTTDLTTGSRRSYVFDLSNGTATTTGGSTWTLVSGSATAVGNGWYRCQMIVTTDATASTMFVSIGLSDTFSVSTFTSGYTGDGYSGLYIWGAQLEAGAFATSYIPTVASQVTRASDAASMTGTNFSSWYNQAEGTLYGEFDWMGLSNNDYFFAINNSNVDNLIALGVQSTPTTRFIVLDNTVTQASITGSTPVANTAFKIAGAYQVNNFRAAINGTLGTADTSGTVPTGMTEVSFSSSFGPTANLVNGHIRKVAYYPLAVTSAQLQALTS